MLSTLSKHKDIILDDLAGPLSYQIETETILISNNEQISNSVTEKIIKNCIKKSNSDILYSVEVIDRKQSNLEDNAQIENELAWLQKKLILKCSNKGEILTVINREQIKEDWFFYKKELKKKYKNSIENIDEILKGTDALLSDSVAFVDLISKSNTGTLLFPPIYNQQLSNKKQLIQYKKFTQFFDDYQLPLALKTTLLDNKKAINHQIMRSGKIDKNKFKSAEVKRFFRTLYNAQDLIVDIDVAYLEAYDLDLFNNIYSATQMMDVDVKDIYRYRQISKLKKTAHV